jgi:hypothetical protein
MAWVYSADGLDDGVGQGVRWQHHGGVARVHPGKLDVLEHAADHDRCPGWGRRIADVGDAIDVHFGGVFEELVDQDRAFGEASTAKRM